ncbi:hypothetical protein FJZ55_05765 [Candidatus Woesearchaeota archaeon]|nr:hypothetical protein [Candidatus Woesearchaeota archaeon]
MVIFDVGGCSYKSTIAKKIAEKFGHKHISIDKLTYKDNWVRRTQEEFRTGLLNEIQLSDKYVIEGAFEDIKNPERETLMRDVVIPNSDIAIYFSVPKSVSLVRKLMRSCKRRLGLEYSDVAHESLKNIKEMIMKTINHYDARKKHLDEVFDEMDQTKLMKIDFPNYPLVK